MSIRLASYLTGHNLRLYFRSPTAVIWTFMFPVFWLVFLMIAFGDDQRAIGTASIGVRDLDGTPLSAQLVEYLERAAFGSLRIDVRIAQVTTSDEASRQSVVIELPAGFEQTVRNGNVVGIKVERQLTYGSATRTAEGFMRGLIVTFVNEARGVAPPRSVAFSAEGGITTERSYGIFILNGTITMLIYSVCLFGFATPLVSTRQSGLIKMFGIMPMPPAAFLAGILLSRLAIITSLTLGMYFIGYQLFKIPVSYDINVLLIYIATVIFASTAFLVLGLAVTSQVRTVARATVTCNLLYYTFVFMSNLFIPDRLLPPWMIFVAEHYPLRHVAETLRQVSLGRFEAAGFTQTYLLLALWSFTWLLFVRPRRLWLWPPRYSGRDAVLRGDG